ncbi:MAG: ROK family protein [Clostridia bacterium]|nr:ROK family protein [Clostridia bacterium]
MMQADNIEKEGIDIMILGVDIGGTDIKFGVVDESYTIIEKLKIPTVKDEGAERIIQDIIKTALAFKERYPIQKIGIGTPGTVDYEKGICIRSANLPYKNTQMVAPIEAATGLSVSIANDASCAVCGELYAGSGRTYKNLVMVTLGTGVGGGIIIDNKPYFGSRGGAGEFGHLIIDRNGLPCRCGQTGCWEAYASVSALISQTEEAAKAHPASKLAELSRSGVSGRTVFEAKKAGCPVAEKVLDTYLDYLATGITSLIRIFQPEAVVLGGAVTNEGETLLAPLKEKVTLPAEVIISSLKNDAGLVGAAAMAASRQ